MPAGPESRRPRLAGLPLRWGAALLLAMATLFPASASAADTTDGGSAGSDPLGVWLTTVDSQVLRSSAERERALAFLRRHGFTRVALPLQTGGFLTWPAAPAGNRLGIPLDPLLDSPDLVHRFSADLRRQGLRTVGWFEFGLMAPADAPWLEGRQDLLLQEIGGGTVWNEAPGLPRVWLNPALPEVRDALTALVIDACRTGDFDLIQFDDHLGYPARFGYDPTTLGLWRQTPEGQARPTPAPDDPAWVAWRSRGVTGLLAGIRARMRSECPGTQLSIAPNPQLFSYQNYLADWSDWVRRSLVDEVVVQIYRQNLDSLLSELRDPSLEVARQRVPLRVGILAGLLRQPKDPELFRREIETLRARGLAGIDVFFYESARRQFDPAQPALGPAGPP